MYRLVGSVLAVLALATCLSAQGQIATVTSAGAFSLRGATVFPDKGIPAWPVMPNDVIVAGSVPTTVTFPDGSVVVLEMGARAQVTMLGDNPVLTLQDGNAEYSLKSLTSVKLIGANGLAITPTGLSGSFSTAAAGKVPAGPARSQTAGSGGSAGAAGAGGLHPLILIVGIGAAAGLGYGVYKGVIGGSSVSPSN